MGASNKRFGSDKAVAEYYDCHRATVWRMVQRGQIPAPVKIGNLTRWDLTKLGIVDDQDAE